MVFSAVMFRMIDDSNAAGVLWSSPTLCFCESFHTSWSGSAGRLATACGFTAGCGFSTGAQVVEAQRLVHQYHLAGSAARVVAGEGGVPSPAVSALHSHEIDQASHHITGVGTLQGTWIGAVGLPGDSGTRCPARMTMFVCATPIDASGWRL